MTEEENPDGEDAGAEEETRERILSTGKETAAPVDDPAPANGRGHDRAEELAITNTDEGDDRERVAAITEGGTPLHLDTQAPAGGAAFDHSPTADETEDPVVDVPPDPGSAEAASPRLQSIVESLLFAADKPLSLRQLGDLLGETELERVRAAVAAIELGQTSRGFQLHSVAGGFQFRTHPRNAEWVQKLLAQKPVRLSRAQLEALAIVSYRQPITRPEIDEIRGVDSGGTLKTLMERSLVRILGKKEEPGRPLLYGTTREFLEFFNLGDLKDLPTLREFHELSEEHRAQVAALEGAAPAGSIEAADEAPPVLSRLEITAPVEDVAELEEIDRIIRSAGASFASDSDMPGEFEAEVTNPRARLPTESEEFELQKTSSLKRADELAEDRADPHSATARPRPARPAEAPAPESADVHIVPSSEEE